MWSDYLLSRVYLQRYEQSTMRTTYYDTIARYLAEANYAWFGKKHSACFGPCYWWQKGRQAPLGSQDFYFFCMEIRGKYGEIQKNVTFIKATIFLASTVYKAHRQPITPE